MWQTTQSYANRKNKPRFPSFDELKLGVLTTDQLQVSLALTIAGVTLLKALTLFIGKLYKLIFST